jgi:hypothetical protein
VAAEDLAVPLADGAARSLRSLVKLRRSWPIRLLHFFADFDQLLRLLLHFLLELEVVVLHDLLNGDCACDDVAEASHPHVSVLLALRTEYVDSLRGLQVEDVLPLARQVVGYIFLREVAIEDVSEEHLFVIRIVKFDFLFFLNLQDRQLEVDHEIALWIQRHLKQLHLFDELLQIAMHFVLGEVCCFG